MYNFILYYTQSILITNITHVFWYRIYAYMETLFFKSTSSSSSSYSEYIFTRNYGGLRNNLLNWSAIIKIYIGFFDIEEILYIQ